MTRIGTPASPTSTKVLLLGSGELGKELCIELKRYGCEVIAVDRYANAPAMQVADRHYVISMLNGAALRQLVIKEKPALIVPEIEAIATATLLELEQEGFTVIPSARAAHLTMNREGIRRLAAEELGLATSPFCLPMITRVIWRQCVKLVFLAWSSLSCLLPVKVNPCCGLMPNLAAAWAYAQEGGRAGKGRVIVEGFVDFDYEITLLTVCSVSGTQFCAPIGHRQEKGDYRESWQPQAMSDAALATAQDYARRITAALQGYGVFGVELFVKGDQVWFSEVSPRPHDTGMVTLMSQNLSEFALHARAILGLPIPAIKQLGPTASAVLLVKGQSQQMSFSGLHQALQEPDTELRLFGKPEVQGERRLGVALAQDQSIQAAIDKALRVIAQIDVAL